MVLNSGYLGYIRGWLGGLGRVSLIVGGFSFWGSIRVVSMCALTDVGLIVYRHSF